MGKTYFWDDEREEVIVHDTPFAITTGSVSKLKPQVFGMYCLDPHHTDPEPRYGKFVPHQWVPIPLEEFPSQFKAWLLIMGVGL